MLDKVVELLRNVDYIGDLGFAKRRNKPRFGQGCFLIRHNKKLANKDKWLYHKVEINYF